jgi:exodeoxyribonuclease V gamma subunit
MRLSTSNRVEALADALAEEVAGANRSFYEPLRLVVPNALVEVWVKQHLARRLGIVANIKAERLGGFLRQVARNTAPDVRIVDRDVMRGELLALLHDPTRLRDPDLAEVNRYLAAGGDVAAGLDRRRVQLAGKLAELFDAYSFSRPDMLAAWRKGALVKGVDEPLQRWQRAAWLGLFGRGQPLAAADVATLPDFFERTPADELRAPEAVHLFGLSYVVRGAPLPFDLRVARPRQPSPRLRAQPVSRVLGGPRTGTPAKAARAPVPEAPRGPTAVTRRRAGPGRRAGAR